METPKDRITGCVPTIDYEINRSHENQFCIARLYGAALADDGTLILYLTTPADKEVHLNMTTENVGNTLLTIDEDTEISDPAVFIVGDIEVIITTYGLQVVTSDIDTKVYNAVDSGTPIWTNRITKFKAGGTGNPAIIKVGTEGILPHVILGVSKRWRITLKNISGAASDAELFLAFHTRPRETGLPAPTLSF